MLRFMLSVFLLFHGTIHLIGFAKAFQFINISLPGKPISKAEGIIWISAALILLSASVLLFLNRSNWWFFAIPGVLLSQILILRSWNDARFGTIANIIILIAIILSAGFFVFQRKFEKDISSALRGQTQTAKLLTEADIAHMPPSVQKYLRYVGVLGKPIVLNYKIDFEGQMREKGKEWFPFTCSQYNFTSQPTRLFFMKANMYGLTVPGYHSFKNGDASMQVKLFGMIPVVDKHGGILNKAETVTIFNDMCLMAPATLTDPSIQWKSVSDSVVDASFTVNGTTIQATLIFNETGQLVNFISDDRYSIADQRQYRFSTPVKDYKNYSGYNLMSYGEAIWHFPDGAFIYGKFHLKEIRYNVSR